MNLKQSCMVLFSAWISPWILPIYHNIYSTLPSNCILRYLPPSQQWTKMRQTCFCNLQPMKTSLNVCVWYTTRFQNKIHILRYAIDYIFHYRCRMHTFYFFFTCVDFPDECLSPLRSSCHAGARTEAPPRQAVQADTILAAKAPHAEGSAVSSNCSHKPHVNPSHCLNKTKYMKGKQPACPLFDN